jgi:hypothetical protein
VKPARALVLAGAIALSTACAGESAGAAAAASAAAPADNTPGISIATAQARPVPDDVAAYVESPAALEYVHTVFPASTSSTVIEATDSDGDPFPNLDSADGFGGLHEVFAFSKAYLSGQSTSNVVTQTDTWVAAIHSPTGSLGYLQLWKSSPSAAPDPGLNSSAKLGTRLDTVGPSSIVIHDAPSNEWFTAEGATLSPLNRLATVEIPAPASFAKAQEVFSQRYDIRGAGAAATPGSMGGAGALSDRQPWYDSVDSSALVAGLLIVVLGLVGLAAGVVLHRRRPRP